MKEGAPKSNTSPHESAAAARKTARAEEIRKRDEALREIATTPSKELGRYIERRKKVGKRGNPETGEAPDSEVSIFYEHTQETGIATKGELRGKPEKGFPGISGLGKRIELFYNGWLRPSRATEKVTENLKVSMIRLGRADKKAVKWSGRLESANDRLEEVTKMIAELEVEKARTEDSIGLDDGIGESYRKELVSLKKEKTKLLEQRGKIQGTLEKFNSKKTNMQGRIEKRVGQRLEKIEKWRGPIEEKYNELKSKEKELKRRVNARSKEYKAVAAKVEGLNERLANAKNAGERRILKRALKATRRLRALESKQLQPELVRLHSLQHDLDYVYKKLRVWDRRANKVRHAAELPSTETPVGPVEWTPVDAMTDTEGLDDEPDEPTTSEDEPDESDEQEGGKKKSLKKPRKKSSKSEGEDTGEDDLDDPEDEPEDTEDENENEPNETEDGSDNGTREPHPPGWTGEGVEVVERGEAFDSHKDKMLAALNEAEGGFRIGQSEEYLELTGAYPFANYDSAGMKEALREANTPEGKRFYELAAMYKEAEETGNVSSEALTAFDLDEESDPVDSSSAFQRAWGALTSMWRVENEEDKPTTTEAKNASPFGDQRYPAPFALPPVTVGKEPKPDTEPNPSKKEDGPDKEPTPEELRIEEIEINLLQLETAMKGGDELGEVRGYLKTKGKGGRTERATINDISASLEKEREHLSSAQIEYLELVIERRELQGEKKIEKTEGDDAEKNEKPVEKKESFSKRKNLVDEALKQSRDETGNMSRDQILQAIDARQQLLRAENMEEASSLDEVVKKGGRGAGDNARRVRKHLIENLENLSEDAQAFLRTVVVFYEGEARTVGMDVPYLKNRKTEKPPSKVEKEPDTKDSKPKAKPKKAPKAKSDDGAGPGEEIAKDLTEALAEVPANEETPEAEPEQEGTENVEGVEPLEKVRKAWHKQFASKDVPEAERTPLTPTLAKKIFGEDSLDQPMTSEDFVKRMEEFLADRENRNELPKVGPKGKKRNGNKAFSLFSKHLKEFKIDSK